MVPEKWVGSIRNFIALSKQIYHNETENRQYISYRVTDFPCDQDPHIYFQLVGKNLGTKALPAELMHSDLLMGFSKADIAIITHLGTKKELEKEHAATKPKLLARIAHQLFGKGGKTKFMLKFPEQEQLVEAVPEEVMTNKEALEMLESHDAAMIGYAAAENRFMEMRRETQELPTCRIICHDLLSDQVTYLDEEREARHTMPLREIFYNKKLLKLFTKLDQQMMSFSAGEAYQRDIATHAAPVALQLLSQVDGIVDYQDSEGNTFKASCLELAFNELMLSQFNPRDRDVIRFAAGEMHQQRLNPKKAVTLRLVSYANELAEYQNEEGIVNKLSFLELAFEPELLDQFSQSDRDRIRFVAGELSKEKSFQFSHS